jgi:hypothetical protein
MMVRVHFEGIMRARRELSWPSLALLGIVCGFSPTARAQCPATSDFNTTIGAGAASAPASDVGYNIEAVPNNPGYNYLVAGTNLYAIRNGVSCAAPNCNPPQWSSNLSATIQNFPTPVPVSSGTGEAIFLTALNGSLYRVDVPATRPAQGTVIAASTQWDTRRNVCPGDQLIATPTVQVLNFSDKVSPGGFGKVINDDLVMVITKHGCGDTTHNEVRAYKATCASRSPGNPTLCLDAPVWIFNPFNASSEMMDGGSEGCYIQYDSSPTSPDVIYCGTGNSSPGQPNVWAINTKTGTKSWSRTLGDDVFSRPQLHGTALYVASFHGSLWKLDTTASGNLLWGSGSISIAGGPAFINTTLWPEFRTGTCPTCSNPTMSYDHFILVGDSNNHLTAYIDSGATATMAWQQTVRVGINTMPVVNNILGKVYLGQKNGIVSQLDLLTGDPEATLTIGGTKASVFTPAIDFSPGASTGNRLTAAVGGEVKRFCIPLSFGASALDEPLTESVHTHAPHALPDAQGQLCKLDVDCQCTCTQSSDCSTGNCNLQTHQCVCMSNSDCRGSQQCVIPPTGGQGACTCSINYNKPPCRVGRCDPATNVCWSAPASDGTVCSDGNACTCDSKNLTSGACSTACGANCDVCLSGECIGDSSDTVSAACMSATCGGVGGRGCAPGQTCCFNVQGALACTNLASDDHNCGACGHNCNPQGGVTFTCRNFKCVRQVGLCSQTSAAALNSLSLAKSADGLAFDFTPKRVCDAFLTQYTPGGSSIVDVNPSGGLNATFKSDTTSPEHGLSVSSDGTLIGSMEVNDLKRTFVPGFHGVDTTQAFNATPFSATATITKTPPPPAPTSTESYNQGPVGSAFDTKFYVANTHARFYMANWSGSQNGGVNAGGDVVFTQRQQVCGTACFWTWSAPQQLTNFTANFAADRCPTPNACLTASQCIGGLCQCGSDKECAPGEVCVNRSCGRRARITAMAYGTRPQSDGVLYLAYKDLTTGDAMIDVYCDQVTNNSSTGPACQDVYRSSTSSNADFAIDLSSVDYTNITDVLSVAVDPIYGHVYVEAKDTNNLQQVLVVLSDLSVRNLRTVEAALGVAQDPQQFSDEGLTIPGPEFAVRIIPQFIDSSGNTTPTRFQQLHVLP